MILNENNLKASNGVNTKTLLIVGAIIVVMAGAALFLRDSSVKPSDTDGNSSGLVVGKNAIYVAEQVPSKTVSVVVVHLEAPGFVVIHEDVVGAPGSILGRSALLAAGETKEPTLIPLLRTTKDDETIYAMLHLDDGDGIFDAGKDMPAKDSVSNEPMMMVVTVSADAIEPGVVKP